LAYGTCTLTILDWVDLLIKAETGAERKCKLSIDKNNFVPASSLGGIILACNDGKITIDNTLDLRLRLVMEQDKPAIRKLLFPAASA